MLRDTYEHNSVATLRLAPLAALPARNTPAQCALYCCCLYCDHIYMNTVVSRATSTARAPPTYSYKFVECLLKSWS